MCYFMFQLICSVGWTSARQTDIQCSREVVLSLLDLFHAQLCAKHSESFSSFDQRISKLHSRCTNCHSRGGEESKLGDCTFRAMQKARTTKTEICIQKCVPITLMALVMFSITYVCPANDRHTYLHKFTQQPPQYHSCHQCEGG